MKKIFFKSILIIIFSIFINLLMITFLSSKNKGGIKMDEWNNHFNYNAVLIGSSHTETALNPRILNEYGNQEFSFYNFGLSNLGFPNTYFLAVDLMNSDHSPSFIFIELGISSQNKIVYTLPLRMFLNFFFNAKNIRFAIQHFSQNYLLNFNWFSTLRLPINLPKYENGFVSLSNEAKTNSALLLKHKKFLLARRYLLPLNNPNVFVAGLPFQPESEALYFYVNDLVEIANKKNIKIYFYLSNRMFKESIDKIYPVYEKIADSIKFNPNIHSDFSVLMTVEKSWDEGHLNEQGSKIYSRIFMEEFERQILDKNVNKVNHAYQ